MLTFLGDAETAIQKIKSGADHHPEGLLPLIAAMHLDAAATNQPTVERMTLIANLYQMGADRPSLILKARRVARLRAVLWQHHLQLRDQTSGHPWRQVCLDNIRRAIDDPETEAIEFRYYCGLALSLEAVELTRELLTRWERLAVDDKALPKMRVVVEMKANAFPNALRAIDQMLVLDPADQWALSQRKAAQDAIKKLAESVP